MKILIVGLGNPGRQYMHTRHNIGFDVIDLFAKRHKARFRPACRALVASFECIGDTIILAKPQTYMNNSGMSVSELMRRHNIRPSELFIVYDDLDLPPGKLRIRLKGSSGGHNGMKSIIAHIHTSDFPRMRIGIGKNSHTINHVLSRASRREKETMKIAIENATDALDGLIENGIDATMNRFNRSEENEK